MQKIAPIQGHWEDTFTLTSAKLDYKKEWAKFTRAAAELDLMKRGSVWAQGHWGGTFAFDKKGGEV